MSIDPTYSKPTQPNNNGKAFAGLLLLVVGLVMLVRQFDFFFFPGWIFSWPMFLIAIGLYSGFKHNFKRPLWIILVIIGCANLIDRIMPNYDFSNYLWPVGLIVFGFWLISRRNDAPYRRHNWQKKNYGYKGDPYSSSNNAQTIEADYTVKPENESQQWQGYNYNNSEDVIDAVSVFGGIKKVVLSKDFKGGEIVNIFGGAELDFTRADINGTVVIEIVQLFGGIKLLVPPHWQVRSDVAAIFSSVDDKRFGNQTVQSADKVLVIKGVSIFAGIDIRSF